MQHAVKADLRPRLSLKTVPKARWSQSEDEKKRARSDSIDLSQRSGNTVGDFKVYTHFSATYNQLYTSAMESSYSARTY